MPQHQTTPRRSSKAQIWAFDDRRGVCWWFGITALLIVFEEEAHES